MDTAFCDPSHFISRTRTVMAPDAPVPTHTLRTHAAPVNAVAFSSDNDRLYSGDGSGRVIVTSTRSLRPIAAWNAHTDGILGVQEWSEADSVIT